jgi:hypothetical protein
MKKMLLLLMLLSQPVVAEESTTSAAKIPEQAKTIEEFVPADWKIEKKIEGDLNQDNHVDTVLELIQKKPVSADADVQRILVIVLKQADNTLHKAAVAEKLLLCPSCFGTMGTNAEIEIQKGVLIVDHLSGSRETQNITQRFRYEPATKKFLLIGEDSVVLDRLTLNSSSKSTNFLTGEQIDETAKDGKTLSTKKSTVPIKPKFIEEVAN